VVTDQTRAAVRRILPTVTDPDFVLYIGDVRQVLAELPDESVHCVVTSPPYWGLRDYAVAGQLGLEPTPDQYIRNMVGVFREVRRVLRRDGTLWLNIGDSYASDTKGSGGLAPSPTLGIDAAGKSRMSEANRLRANRRAAYEPRRVQHGLKQKDLCGIPWRLAFALQQDGWYLRAEIIWAKPNPMPESVTDRPTKAHEQVFLLTRSPRYFYDADAVRESAEYGRRDWNGGVNFKGGDITKRHGQTSVTGADPSAGRNLRSVWEIPTEPFPQAHFATYPQALVERCVKAGTSEHGCCPECGAPWERETEVAYRNDTTTSGRPAEGNGRKRDDPVTQAGFASGVRTRKHTTTLGWHPTCDCPTDGTYLGETVWKPPPPIPCTVFDPFIGSGTTALVARRLGRKCVGIELSLEYAQICLERTRQLSLLAT
jgi:DNA modification methylase